VARKARAGTDGGDRLTKEDWVSRATDTLARQGVAAVRIEVLAKALEVTKGSFYWHFKDRNALLAEVLSGWRAVATGRAELIAAEQTSDARERIRLLMEYATTSDFTSAPGGRLEQAIREWAVTSEAAAEALRQVDLDRLEILGAMYRDTGMKKAEAQAYAFLLYGFTIGSNRITHHIGRQAAQALRNQIGQILTP
jgi:AcrR family transcriptional regulator